jgi:hypothetical protein
MMMMMMMVMMMMMQDDLIGDLRLQDEDVQSMSMTMSSGAGEGTSSSSTKSLGGIGRVSSSPRLLLLQQQSIDGSGFNREADSTQREIIDRDQVESRKGESSPSSNISSSAKSSSSSSPSVVVIGNRAKLLKARYCHVLVKMLELHMADSATAKVVCRTIFISASDESSSSERGDFAATNLCHVMSRAMQLYEADEGMGRIMCWTLKALTYHHNHNRDNFRKAGVCGQVLLVLRSFRYSRFAADTVESAAAAIANLCQVSHELSHYITHLH